MIKCNSTVVYKVQSYDILWSEINNLAVENKAKFYGWRWSTILRILMKHSKCTVRDKVQFYGGRRSEILRREIKYNSTVVDKAQFYRWRWSTIYGILWPETNNYTAESKTQSFIWRWSTIIWSEIKHWSGFTGESWNNENWSFFHVESEEEGEGERLTCANVVSAK